MTEPHHDFEWQAASQYEIISAVEVGDPSNEHRRWLTDATGNKSGRAVRVVRYRPLTDYSGLFRTFASTPLDDESLIAFATKYGPLGFGESRIRLADGGGDASIWGEPLGVWHREISVMNTAVAFWDTMTEADSEERTTRLDVLLGLTALHADYYDAPSPVEAPIFQASQRRWPTVEQQRQQWITAEVNRAEPIERAWLWLQQSVSERLSTTTICVAGLDEKRDSLHITATPRNLLGAMWLQLADSIEHQRKYRRCRICGTWFELNPVTGRTNRLHCSVNCRNKAHRIRTEAAKRSGDGMPVAEIANQMSLTEELIEELLDTSKLDHK